jgi:ABC-type phosphate transport system auxiliary subunit
VADTNEGHAATPEPSNADLFREIREWRRELNGRVDKLEDWRLQHSTWSDNQVASINSRFDRQMQMTRDALDSWLRDTFTSLYEKALANSSEARLAELETMLTTIETKKRKERKEDISDAFRGSQFVIKYVLTALQLVATAAVVYAFFVR